MTIITTHSSFYFKIVPLHKHADRVAITLTFNHNLQEIIHHSYIICIKYDMFDSIRVSCNWYDWYYNVTGNSLGLFSPLDNILQCIIKIMKLCKLNNFKSLYLKITDTAKMLIFIHFFLNCFIYLFIIFYWASILVLSMWYFKQNWFFRWISFFYVYHFDYRHLMA